MTQETKHDGCGIQDEITSLTGLTIPGIHAGYWPAQKSIKFTMKSLIMKMLGLYPYTLSAIYPTSFFLKMSSQGCSLPV